MSHLKKTGSRKRFIRAMSYRASPSQTKALYRATEKIMRGKYFKYKR